MAARQQALTFTTPAEGATSHSPSTGPSPLARAPARLPCLMVPVLLLFLLPVGGGIPAGVLLARAKGLPWPLTAGLYLVSDLLLAVAFEPVLRLLVLLGGKVAFLARFGAAMRASMARSAQHFTGTGAGPVSLLLIAFGVDPMTGRSAALAAGHGFLAGWGFAIAGDMLYFTVIALATLQLNALFHNPDTAMFIVLGAMLVVPLVVRRFQRRKPA